ncbi:MAG: aspartate aminotransferase family protein [Thermodesulfobacteriota bacterium]
MTIEIPEKGMARDEIMQTLRSYKGEDLDWHSGRVMGYVYDPGEKAMEVINEAYTMYLSENALDPTTYPSLLRIENELTRMIANLLQGDENVVGNFTSGGTESLILAVKTARDMMRVKKPEIKEPEMVLPITAHSSFYKAAHYLCVKPVIVPVLDGSYRTDIAAMRDAITENTILLVGSAPGYAHGVVDPIPEIAKLALEHDLPCHVDGCVGGIHLSYMRKMGYAVPEFDFTVPGVTSISADLHKYGYAAKGASVILYKNQEIRRHQMFACSRWTGYTVINPAVTSSKTGGPMAAAWAVLNYLGDEGYRKIVKEVMEATQLTLEGIAKIDGIEVLGKPDMCMYAFAATSEKLNVYRLADRMKTKGWFLQPQFARNNSPSNLHVSFNRLSVPRAKEFLSILEQTVAEVMAEKVDDKTSELRAEIEKLSINFDEESFFKLAEMAGITGLELPEKMETINQLLEALPYDVSEFMLVEFLNNLMK